VAPTSSFCSDLLGFRVTLLEEDPKKMEWLYARLKAAVAEYLGS
jgi:alanine-synthesizing transaminase